MGQIRKLYYFPKYNIFDLNDGTYSIKTRFKKRDNKCLVRKLRKVKTCV